MPITAAAPAFVGNGAISTTERTWPEPGDGRLLLRVAANAMCGSDRGQLAGGSDVVPGHEVAGTVLQAGPDTATAVGTRGVVYLMEFCGVCRSCRVGATNQCLDKRADVGFTVDGGYGPVVEVAERTFFPVPDDVDLVTATMLLDVMGTSGHAIGRARLVRPDIERVFIAGAGPIGLGLTLMCRLLLGRDVPVHVSDVSDDRLALAAALGGIAVRADDPDLARAVGEVDAAFDSSGRASARRAAIDLLGKRGVLVCVGHGETIDLDVSRDLLAPERAVLGSEYFRFDELPGNLALLRANTALVERVITHRLPVSRIAEAFDLFLAGRTGKVVVVQEEA